MADANVNINVNADTSSASNGLNSLNGQLQNTQNQLNNAGNSSQAFGKKLMAVGSQLTSIGMAMTAAVTLPLLGVAGASIKLASDFAENVNKVDVIFKQNAEGVKTWAKGMITGFGIAEGSALEMVSRFGDMGSSMGLSADKTASMSKSLVELAGDMASFKNVGIAQAQTALQGIFTGEGEALKSMGIAMTVANLEAYALANGTKKVYKEMSEAEKIQLRYNYILSVTKASQGDFARTSDQLANSSRTLMEKIKELGVSFGKELLPIITPIVVKLTDLVQSFTDLSPAMKKNILVGGLILAVLGPLVVVIGVLIALVGAIMAVGAPVAAIIALVVIEFVALTTATVLLAQRLMSKAIPAIDLFGDKTSAATKKAVGSYLDLDKSTSQSLKNMELNGTKVSKDMSTKLVANFDNMGKQIKAGMDKHNKETIDSMTKFFADSTVLSTAEEAKRLTATGKSNENRKAQIDKYTKEETDIVQKARDNNVELTKAEHLRLDELARLKKESAITYLSETEVEAKAIRQRMKDSAGTMNTLELAEVVKSSMANRDTQIKNANETYDGKVKAIIRMRDEAGTISEEEANKMIAEATKTKDGVISEANKTHTGVITEAKAQSKEHTAEIDWETGEIKTKWQMLKENVVQTSKDMGQGVKNWFADMGKGSDAILADMKKRSVDKFNEIRDGYKKTMDGMKADISNGWKNIVNSFNTEIAKIRKGIDDFKKGFANMFKGIHMPSFTFSGSMNPVKWASEGMPTVGVKYNAKGGIYEKATLLGGNNVVGEAGSEAIIPLSNKSAVQPFALAVASQFMSLLPESFSDQGRSGSGLTVVFNGAVVREDKDVEKIAQEIYKIQQRNRRGRGGNV